MTALDWIIVLVLNGGIIAYGFVLARGTHTSQEWFLGNRSLLWWTIGFSMFATNMDNADLVSLTGTSFREGLHIIAVHTVGALVGAILAAFYLVPAMFRAGQFTNAEYLEARFGISARVLSALIQIQYRSSMLGLMIWSIYLLLTRFLGLDTPLAWTFVVGIVALAAIYTSWGGLKTVVLTDVLQGIVMFTGMAVIFSSVWRAAGGWGGMKRTLETVHTATGTAGADLLHMGRYFGDNGATPPVVIFMGWILIGGGYWTVNHTQTMRLLGARSLWDMKMAALFGVMISMPVAVGCATLGVFGRALFPQFAQPDTLYPHMADLFLGAGLKGLVVAGIVAAAISTFDSMGASLSAVFTRDIYARLISGRKDDAHYVRVSRWATLGILASGFLYIPFISSKDTMLKAFLTLIPVFVTPLFGVYLMGVFTRAHRRAGWCGIVAGAAYGLVALGDRELGNVTWLAPWFTGRWVALCWSLGFTFAGGLLATLVWGRQAPEAGSAPAGNTPDTWLARSRGSLPPILEHPFADRVPALLRPEWIAAVLLAGTLFCLFSWFW